MDNQRTRDIKFMALTIYGEARNECRRRKYAIALTIRNRQESGDPKLAGETVEETCTKPYQYPCWNDKKFGETEIGNEYLQIAMDVYDGIQEDFTHGKTKLRRDEYMADIGSTFESTREMNNRAAQNPPQGKDTEKEYHYNPYKENDKGDDDLC